MNTNTTPTATEIVADSDRQIGWLINGTNTVCLQCAVDNFEAPENDENGNLVNARGMRFVPSLAADQAGCSLCGAYTRKVIEESAALALDVLRQVAAQLEAWDYDDGVALHKAAGNAIERLGYALAVEMD